MKPKTSLSEHSLDEKNAEKEMQQFVTVTIASQMFGIPVLQIQDILAPQQTTRIPLAPKEVAGGLNLRDRVECRGMAADAFRQRRHVVISDRLRATLS